MKLNNFILIFQVEELINKTFKNTVLIMRFFMLCYYGSLKIVFRVSVLSN